MSRKGYTSSRKRIRPNQEYQHSTSSKQANQKNPLTAECLIRLNFKNIRNHRDRDRKMGRRLIQKINVLLDGEKGEIVLYERNHKNERSGNKSGNQWKMGEK